jgi:hypothetical protein
MLSDAEWAQIAADIMHLTGLAPHGQEDDAVRWIAVRHGEDHIHLVAMLARQDGTRPRFWNDYYRLGEACQAAEEKYGLARTPPRDGTAARRPSRAETEKAARQRHPEPARVTLRRAVAEAAAVSRSEDDFFARLAVAGIGIRRRYSQRNPGQVTGYAVALPGHQARDGKPVFFSGGKLAADLTLPALRRRWPDGCGTGTDRQQRLNNMPESTVASPGCGHHVRARGPGPQRSALLALGPASRALRPASTSLKDAICMACRMRSSIGMPSCASTCTRTTQVIASPTEAGSCWPS